MFRSKEPFCLLNEICANKWNTLNVLIVYNCINVAIPQSLNKASSNLSFIQKTSHLTIASQIQLHLPTTVHTERRTIKNGFNLPFAGTMHTNTYSTHKTTALYHL